MCAGRACLVLLWRCCLLRLPEAARGPGPRPARAPGAAPRTGTGCLDAAGQPMPSSALLGQGGTLRLSVVRAGPTGGALRLRRVAQVPEQTPRAWTWAAAEGAPLRRLRRVVRSRRAPAPPPAPCPGCPSPTRRAARSRCRCFRCRRVELPAGGARRPAAPSTPPRRCPSGAVLLIGGVAALPEQGPSMFQLLNSVEVYDPRAPASSPSRRRPGVVPRAARLPPRRAPRRPAGARCGSSSTAALTAPLRRAALDGAPQGLTQLRFTPIGTTQAAGGELLTYELAARQLTRPALPEADFPRVAFAGGAALPGGGLAARRGRPLPGRARGRGAEEPPRRRAGPVLALPPAAGGGAPGAPPSSRPGSSRRR